MGKVKSLAEISKIVGKEKKKGRKVGLITGCFDIIHIGHIELFKFAKKHCDVVIVGVENDSTLHLLKGNPRPIYITKNKDWNFLVK